MRASEAWHMQATYYSTEIDELFAILRDKWPMLATPENLETPISYVVPHEDLRVLQARILELLFDWAHTIDTWTARGGLIDE